MLSDIITLILGLALILFTIQAMMDPETRKKPTEVIRSMLVGVGGIFLVYFWNVNTRLNLNTN